MLFASFTEAGFDVDARSAAGRAMRLEYIAKVVGRPITTTLTLTAAEASQVIDALRTDAQDRVWRTDADQAGQTTEDAEVVEDAEIVEIVDGDLEDDS